MMLTERSFWKRSIMACLWLSGVSSEMKSGILPVLAEIQFCRTGPIWGNWVKMSTFPAVSMTLETRSSMASPFPEYSGPWNRSVAGRSSGASQICLSLMMSFCTERPRSAVISSALRPSSLFSASAAIWLRASSTVP